VIDIHSHVLAGVDDGPSSVEQSIEMVLMAARDGITDIVATVHANSEYDCGPARVATKAAELVAAAGQSIRIHTCFEILLSYDRLRRVLSRPCDYTINGRTYLLVEFPGLLSLHAVDESLAYLLSAGIRPVLAHPERTSLFRRGWKRVTEWVRNGCLVQITAHSLLGHFGPEARKFSCELLRRNLVHFVGSDAHDCDKRPPLLKEAYRYVARHHGEQRAAQLFIRNPAAAVAGRSL